MKRFFLLMAACILALHLPAQNKIIKGKIAAPRPKIGVVLGGGGAKGAAHIGVLKYLEEVGIPIDYVAGTSIGSIIGGLYAMGYSPDELADLIANMNWSEYVGNSIDRTTMSLETRQRNSTTIINLPFSLNRFIHDRQPMGVIPTAFVNNTALINLFNDLCVGYQKEMDFNDLPIPFACVATDIRKGEEVVIRHGSVPTAMRASMAIPGVFSPVKMGNHILVDGGLVNNFPVDVITEMGADIIIGVEVTDADTVISEDDMALTDVLNRLIDNAVNTKRYENQTLCHVHLTPDITGYGTLSFNHDAIDTLVTRGYKEAKKHEADFRRLKEQLEAITGKPLTKTLHNTKAKNLADAPVFISSIVFNLDDQAKCEWLLRKGKLKVGNYISEKEINHAVSVYRGTGAFDDITYNLTENGLDTIDGEVIDTYSLTMKFKPTHPHVFSLGLRYDTEEGAGMLLKLGLNEKHLNGFKLNLSGKLSYNPKFNITGTYSSINLANFNVAYDYRSEHYKAMFDEKYSNLRYNQHKISAYVSQFHLLNISTAVGASFAITAFDQGSPFDFGNDTGNQNPDSTASSFQNNVLLSPFAKFRYDNLDHPYFAKRGINTALNGTAHFDVSGNNIMGEVGYYIQGYITPKDGRFTLIPQLYARCLFGEAIYANLQNIVGSEIVGRHFDHQMPFIGIIHTEYVNDFTAIARLDLRYRLLDNHYFSATYNFLYGFDPFGKGIIKNTTMYSGAGIGYAYNSFFGPISASLVWSNCIKGVGAYLSIGYTF